MEEGDKWWKIFRMLGSDNEREAIAALRKLKHILEEKGKNWNWFSDRLKQSLLRSANQNKAAEKFFQMMEEILR